MGISYDDIEGIIGLSKPRISYFVRIFEEDYGLIKTKTKNKGRLGGNKRTIFFNYNFFRKIEESGMIKIKEEERETINFINK